MFVFFKVVIFVRYKNKKSKLNGLLCTKHCWGLVQSLWYMRSSRQWEVWELWLSLCCSDRSLLWLCRCALHGSMARLCSSFHSAESGMEGCLAFLVFVSLFLLLQFFIVYLNCYGNLKKNWPELGLVPKDLPVMPRIILVSIQGGKTMDQTTNHNS